MSVFADLRRREQSADPIRVAVVGTGFFGRGLLWQLARMPGFVPAVAANRTVERAVEALVGAGVDPQRIRRCDDPESARVALESGKHVATASLNLPTRLGDVDVIMETTGDVLVGCEIALEAIRHGKHLVAANTETQATVGPILKVLADEAGVVYSDVDGDQPGVLKNLYDYCTGLGLEPVVAGNCKGVLKRYATPETQAAFAEAHGLRPWIACAAADGTKIAIEMAVVANATGMAPATPGMVGPQTTLDTLLEDFGRFGLLSDGPIVEYTLGIPSGVFMVVHGDDPELRPGFRYARMGEGPYYLFYRPHVLLHYEAPLSAAEAVLYGAATIAPSGAPVAEVATFAKQDLRAGQRLDGIGGFDCYGLVMRADEVREGDLLPIGLAGYGRLTRDIAKDDAIPRDAVEFEEDNLALELRARQDALFADRRVGSRQ